MSGVARQERTTTLPILEKTSSMRARLRRDAMSTTGKVMGACVPEMRCKCDADAIHRVDLQVKRVKLRKKTRSAQNFI